ncbi:MAG: hypothetical protein JWR10_1716 [Rubritepida sp.]|nr:hypothetical protein [Rubritepida sp.]
MTPKQPDKANEAKGRPDSGREQTEAVLEQGMPPEAKRSDHTGEKPAPDPKAGKAK